MYGMCWNVPSRKQRKASVLLESTENHVFWWQPSILQWPSAAEIQQLKLALEGSAAIG